MKAPRGPGYTHTTVRTFSRHIALGAVLAASAACAVRHVPVRPLLEPRVADQTPRLPGQVVALVMDPAVTTFQKQRDFSLLQQERYASGEHFARSLLAQLRARGVTVLEVDSEDQARQVGAPVTLVPDAPGLRVIRPKGLLDFSFLGSVNHVKVSYSVMLQRPGAATPERVSGSGSRTASFLWSNALVQGVGLWLLGSSVSLVIYGGWMGYVVYQAAQRRDVPSDPWTAFTALAPPPHVAIAVFVADHLLSQATAQVVPRVINPLVDVLINEPRWQQMVQGAHDDAAADVADEIVRRLAALRPAQGVPP